MSIQETSKLAWSVAAIRIFIDFFRTALSSIKM